jgi:prepilin-type N-terminal cleavage/methylation domain-containing protein
MMQLRNTRGVTLVELLVAVVVGTIVMGAVFAVLVSNQRIYAVQGERILGQQTVRAGAEILATELRDISVREGDILTMEEDEVVFRAGRSFAVVCEVLDSSPLSVVAWVGAGGFAEGDSVFVFSDGDPASSDDDLWLTGAVAGSETSVDQCGVAGRPEIQIDFQGLDPSAGQAGVRQGAQVRGFEVVRYESMTYANQPYLGRALGTDGRPEPIVGPLAPTGGLAFAYLDGAGNAVTDRRAVRAFQITIRTASGIVDQAGRPVADSLTVIVNARN